jgi:hypothetical protein
MGRYVLPVLGAAIGSIFGPAGAMWGWQVSGTLGDAREPQIVDEETDEPAARDDHV